MGRIITICIMPPSILSVQAPQHLPHTPHDVSEKLHQAAHPTNSAPSAQPGHHERSHGPLHLWGAARGPKAQGCAKPARVGGGSPTRAHKPSQRQRAVDSRRRSATSCGSCSRSSIRRSRSSHGSRCSRRRAHVLAQRCPVPPATAAAGAGRRDTAAVGARLQGVCRGCRRCRLTCLLLLSEVPGVSGCHACAR
jgi:hypothetical protein